MRADEGSPCNGFLKNARDAYNRGPGRPGRHFAAQSSAVVQGMRRAWVVALGIILVECNGETVVRKVARLSPHKVGFIVDVGTFDCCCRISVYIQDKSLAAYATPCGSRTCTRRAEVMQTLYCLL